jgi:hypothetical protein
MKKSRLKIFREEIDFLCDNYTKRIHWEKLEAVAVKVGHS